VSLIQSEERLAIHGKAEPYRNVLWQSHYEAPRQVDYDFYASDVLSSRLGLSTPEARVPLRNNSYSLNSDLARMG
jgi:hypothetical protein